MAAENSGLPFAAILPFIDGGGPGLKDATAR